MEKNTYSHTLFDGEGYWGHREQIRPTEIDDHVTVEAIRDADRCCCVQNTGQEVKGGTWTANAQAPTIEDQPVTKKGQFAFRSANRNIALTSAFSPVLSFGYFLK